MSLLRIHIPPCSAQGQGQGVPGGNTALAWESISPGWSHCLGFSHKMLLNWWWVQCGSKRHFVYRSESCLTLVYWSNVRNILKFFIELLPFIASPDMYCPHPRHVLSPSQTCTVTIPDLCCHHTRVTEWGILEMKFFILLCILCLHCLHSYVIYSFT